MFVKSGSRGTRADQGGTREDPRGPSIGVKIGRCRNDRRCPRFESHALVGTSQKAFGASFRVTDDTTGASISKVAASSWPLAPPGGPPSRATKQFSRHGGGVSRTGIAFTCNLVAWRRVPLINLRLGAVRRLAYEAADCGFCAWNVDSSSLPFVGLIESSDWVARF